MRRVAVWAVAGVLILSLAGCGSDEPDRRPPAAGGPSTTTPAESGPSSATTVSAGPAAPQGAAAVWEIDPEQPPAAEATTFTAMVARLGCSGGRTGEVLAPTVTAGDEQVVVTFTVETLPDGAYTCPGNDRVPSTVELDAPVGDRELLDGACLSGAAVSTSHCLDGPVRWPARDRS